MSSKSAPSWDEVQKNPLGALSKGWGLFSSAVATAGKEINTAVVQPGLARGSELAQQVQQGQGGAEWQRYLNQGIEGARSAAGWAGQKANESLTGLNQVAKERGYAAGGDDDAGLTDHLAKVGLGRSGMEGRGGGYGHLGAHDTGDEGDAFFEAYHDGPDGPSPTSTTGLSGPSAAKGQGKAGKAKEDDWDNW